MNIAFRKFQRWLPQRLTSQMICLLLTALVIAQVANFLIFMDERRAAIRLVERTQILERTTLLIRLIESSPAELHNQMVRAASSKKLYFWFGVQSPIPKTSIQENHDLMQRLKKLLGAQDFRELRIWTHEQQNGVMWKDHMIQASDGTTTRLDQPDQVRALPLSEVDPPGLLLSAQLGDGRWLNVGLGINPPLSRWAMPTLISMSLAVGSICLIVVFMVKRMTRPLGKLAEAAERVGRGDTLIPLREEGPIDVRQTIRAFNRMYDRIQRFVQDRTRMLAAISHDLRTPITSLRLQAELIDDHPAKEKMLHTLDEMQRITEATLALARDEASVEKSRAVDLSALLDSLCQDLAELGMDVGCESGGKIPYTCRPVSLKRALRNLIENAVLYGHRARVSLQRSDAEYQILIHDAGPGIPEKDFELVFHPFVRLETSRNQATGGIGLGMSIARSIVRNHGGDISLANSAGGGFLVTIHLPVHDFNPSLSERSSQLAHSPHEDAIAGKP